MGVFVTAETILGRAFDSQFVIYFYSRSVQLDQRFQKAVAMTGAEFEDCLNGQSEKWSSPAFFHVDSVVHNSARNKNTGFAYSWLPARSIVERAVANRFEVDKSGEILMLDTFTVWKDHLFTIEEEQKLTGR